MCFACLQKALAESLHTYANTIPRVTLALCANGAACLMPFKPDRVLDTLHKQHSTVMHVVALKQALAACHRHSVQMVQHVSDP